MKRLFQALFLSATVALLSASGCATTPQNPQQSVFAAKTSYAVALAIAVSYKRLATCGLPGATALCSDPKVVHQLQAADNAAAALLDGAENVVRSENAGINAETAALAAQQAVSAFSTITAVLKVK